jgi:hypothetical protein
MTNQTKERVRGDCEIAVNASVSPYPRDNGTGTGCFEIKSEANVV